MFKKTKRLFRGWHKAHCDAMFDRVTPGIYSMDRLLLRLACHGADQTRALQEIASSVEGIRDAMLEHCEAAKEDALGPFQYEITASDLFELSARHRMIVAESGATCFNDIHVARLHGISLTRGVCQHDIEKIMEWKRECIARITEQQVSDAINAQQETK